MRKAPLSTQEIYKRKHLTRRNKKIKENAITN